MNKIIKVPDANNDYVQLERLFGPFAIDIWWDAYDVKGVDDVGYWLGVDHWGRGFATEAARAAIDFAFEEFSVEQLISGARVANIMDFYDQGDVAPNGRFNYRFAE